MLWILIGPSILLSGQINTVEVDTFCSSGRREATAAIFMFLGSHDDKRRVEKSHAIGLLRCFHPIHVALPVTIQDLLALMPFRAQLADRLKVDHASSLKHAPIANCLMPIPLVSSQLSDSNHRSGRLSIPAVLFDAVIWHHLRIVQLIICTLQRLLES
jgi:hypothetical protein